MANKAVCLYSGGLDSTTCVYIARHASKIPILLTIDYGQLHHQETKIAAAHAKELGLKHYQIKTALPWGGSALLDSKIPLAHDRSPESMTDIPASYVPARNSVLLSLACSCAEAEGASEVYLGVNHLDYSGYPDCRPDFITAFQEMIRKGTKTGDEGHAIQIQTPLLTKTKKEIVLIGQSLGVPFQKTWSCYRGDRRPCHTCDACILRARGFEEAGVQDPLLNN